MGLAHAADANGVRKGGCRVCGLKCEAFRPKPKPNKYHAQKQEFQGVRYDSKFEARVAADLDLQFRAGEIKSIERQVRVPLIVNGRKICTYIPDFKITHADGTIEYREAKGFRTDTYRIKRNLFEALHIDGKKVKFTELTQ